MGWFLTIHSWNGNVSGEGQPLEGTNVIVVGTDLGVVSDKDGSYLVDVLPVNTM